MVVIFFKCAFVNYCITVVDLYVVGKFTKTLTAMLMKHIRAKPSAQLSKHMHNYIALLL